MLDEVEEAMSQRDRALEEALRYFHLAYEQQMQGNIPESISYYQKSIDTYPTAEAYTFLGWTYSFMEEYEQAIANCRHAIDLDPDYGNPYNDIGAYLIEQGKLDEAVPWLEKALIASRYESYCFPHFNLGRVWERKGQWRKALDCYRKALENNPQYALAERAIRQLQAKMN